MSLEVTPSLKSALSELYSNEGVEYIFLKDISIKHNILIFNKGAHWISIKLMDSIVPGIKEISSPVNEDFLFNYQALSTIVMSFEMCLLHPERSNSPEAGLYSTREAQAVHRAYTIDAAVRPLTLTQVTTFSFLMGFPRCTYGDVALPALVAFPALVV